MASCRRETCRMAPVPPERGAAPRRRGVCDRAGDICQAPRPPQGPRPKGPLTLGLMGHSIVDRRDITRIGCWLGQSGSRACCALLWTRGRFPVPLSPFLAAQCRVAVVEVGATLMDQDQFCSVGAVSEIPLLRPRRVLGQPALHKALRRKPSAGAWCTCAAFAPRATILGLRGAPLRGDRSGARRDGPGLTAAGSARMMRVINPQ